MVRVIKDHVIILETSGSGSWDPWTSKFASEHGVSLWGTSDMAKFVLVDNSKIYKVQWHPDLYKDLEKVNNWEDFKKWLEKYLERDDGTLEENILHIKNKKDYKE